MRILRITTLLLIFFPFIGFFPGTDVQPFYLLLSIIFLISISNKILLNQKDLFLIISSLLLIIIRGTLISDVEIHFVSLAKLLFSLLTPVTIFLLVKNRVFNIGNTYPILIFSLGVIIVVGFIQLFSPDFLTFLVSRSEDSIERLINSGRGVRSLFPEPSSFGKQLILSNILLIFNSSKFRDKHNFLFSLILLFCNLLLVRSAYSFAFHFILVLFYFVKPKYLFKFFLTIITILSFYFLAGSGFEPIIRTSRIFKIFNALLIEPEILMNQGAFKRLINIPITLNNLFNHYGILGSYGIEQNYYSSISTPIGEYRYTASNRNLGGIIEYLLLYGIFSIPWIIWIFYKVLVPLNKKKSLLILYTLFLILQDGSTSNPFSWFTIFLITSTANEINS